MQETDKRDLWEFDYQYFPYSCLQKLNQTRQDGFYGAIYVQHYSLGKTFRYRVEVTYETKEAFGRNGIVLEVYTVDSQHCYGKWDESIREITSAKDYRRFCTRLQKIICQKSRCQELSMCVEPCK